MTHDSPAWTAYAYAAFGLAVALQLVGVYHLPTDLWTKGYFVMGLAFLVGSTFTLAKTLRDRHEHHQLTHRLDEARNEKLLRTSFNDED